MEQTIGGTKSLLLEWSQKFVLAQSCYNLQAVCGGAWQKRVLEVSAGIVTLACVVDLPAERTEAVTFIVACQCTVDGRVV